MWGLHVPCTHHAQQPRRRGRTGGRVQATWCMYTREHHSATKGTERCHVTCDGVDDLCLVKQPRQRQTLCDLTCRCNLKRLNSQTRNRLVGAGGRKGVRKYKPPAVMSGSPGEEAGLVTSQEDVLGVTGAESRPQQLALCRPDSPCLPQPFSGCLHRCLSPPHPALQPGNTSAQSDASFRL